MKPLRLTAMTLVLLFSVGCIGHFSTSGMEASIKNKKKEPVFVLKVGETQVDSELYPGAAISGIADELATAYTAVKVLFPFLP